MEEGAPQPKIPAKPALCCAVGRPIQDSLTQCVPRGAEMFLWHPAVIVDGKILTVQGAEEQLILVLDEELLSTDRREPSREPRTDPTLVGRLLHQEHCLINRAHGPTLGDHELPEQLLRMARAAP